MSNELHGERKAYRGPIKVFPSPLHCAITFNISMARLRQNAVYLPPRREHFSVKVELFLLVKHFPPWCIQRHQTSDIWDMAIKNHFTVRVCCNKGQAKVIWIAENDYVFWTLTCIRMTAVRENLSAPAGCWHVTMKQQWTTQWKSK